MANSWRPSVLPERCRVITRLALVLDSVHWLKAAPLMESTSKPSGMRKLKLKMPALLMSAAKLSASVVWSSPSDKVSRVSTRTSGSTAEAFKDRLAAVSE